MIKNNVQFTYDGAEQMYTATVKIVNKAKDQKVLHRDQEQQSSGYYSGRGGKPENT